MTPSERVVQGGADGATTRRVGRVFFVAHHTAGIRLVVALEVERARMGLWICRQSRHIFMVERP